MKTIPNELLLTIPPSPKNPEGTIIYVKDLILNALDQPPQGGFNRQNIKARTRVEDTLSRAEPKGDILFEDQDYDTAKECIDACGWLSRGPHIRRLFELFP